MSINDNDSATPNPGGGTPIGEHSLLDAAAEDAYWREAYSRERHYDPAYRYDDYAPAYRTGYEGAARYAGQSFDAAEPRLREDYSRLRGSSALEWEHARLSARSAWDRLTGAASGNPGIVSNPPGTR